MSNITTNNIIPLLIFFSLFISSLSKKKIMILEGDQIESQIQLSFKSNKKLFLIFYTNNCQYCTMALKILKTQIAKYFEEEDDISFGSINLDDQKNIWLGLRFNVTRIPFIILIENKRMYLYQKIFEEKNVIEFINEEKNIEDGVDIPDEITFFTKFKAAVRELSDNIEKYLEIFGISKTWGIKISYFLLITGVIAFIYLENKFINFCKNFFWNKNRNTNKSNFENNNNKDETNVDKKEKTE